jgi:hypothetical protein
MRTLIDKSNPGRAAVKDGGGPKNGGHVFSVGQRVRISGHGLESMILMPRSSRTGTIASPQQHYPGSISVLRDGAKTPLSYHPSYWEPSGE